MDTMANLTKKPSSSERPRERLLAHGVGVLTTAELLAIVLRTGLKGCNAVALGQHLLDRFSGLRPLLASDIATLTAVPGLGLAKACELAAINELNRRALSEALKIGELLNHPQRVREYCLALLGHLSIEHCIALFLDNQLRLITTEEISRGTLTQASVYPREIIKSGLKHHAAALILAHNHPSGVAEPSQADLALTQHLKKALALVDIRLLDHLIVADKHTISLAERGQL
ncbi:MAG: DNA repair protein RadC [Burkholderiaceae bacterium]|jgi:DNA repair protein RadC